MGRGRRRAGCADLYSVLRGDYGRFASAFSQSVGSVGRFAGLCRPWRRMIILPGLL